MNKRVVFALLKKELTDIFRDKKTLLMMIVVPLILYPLIVAGSLVLMSSIAASKNTEVFKIAFENISEDNAIEKFIEEHSDEHDYSFVILDEIYQNNTSSDAENNEETVENEEKTAMTYDEAIRAGALDAYIRESDGAFEIVCYSSKTPSVTAAGMLEDMMDDYAEHIRYAKVMGAQLDPEDILYSVDYSVTNIASGEESVGSIFGYIIPFLLISSVLMGAMYPAIDTTAGEKERGTMETMLTMPVSNLELIMSKFLATSVIAVMAAMLNVLSMGLLCAYFYESLMLGGTDMTGFSLSLYIPAVLITLLASVIFAMFSSAICLLVCIFAKSFKEAQNYSTPIVMVFMFGGMAGMIPGIELNTKTALIPVVNIALLIGKAFALEIETQTVLYVLLSNLAYIIIAVLIMAKVFNSEKILFSDGIESIHIIERRSHMKKGQIPGAGDLLLLFSVMLLVLLFAGSVLVLKFGIYGVALQQCVIIGVTLLYAWYIKTDIRKLFSFKLPRIKYILGGLIGWMGLFILINFLSNFLIQLFPVSDSASYDLILKYEDECPFIVMALIIALAPAVCEEIAFRGFLFGSLRYKNKIVTSVIISGIIFGVFHMELIKIIPVSLLGIFFAYCVYKSDSIFVSMLLHFLNNFTAVVVSTYPFECARVVPFLVETEITVTDFAVMSVIGIVLLLTGIYIMHDGKKKTNKTIPENAE